jgi:regulatory protein
MPTITRLVAGKHNPNRVNIYLDGQFNLALSLDAVVKQGLKKGLELSAAQIASLHEIDEADKIYAKILNYISFRPRSVKEVRDRLKQYEVKEPNEQNLLIERLKKHGYLDDLKFAEWFVQSRNIHKLRSPRAIMAELASKGISLDIQAQVLPMINDSASTIFATLTKKLGEPHPLELVERQKIGSYLVSHGFAWDIVKEVVKTWESE